MEKKEESEKKKLVERRKLLQNLAALSKKNPDFSLEEIIQNSPELTKENKELCLKLVKKDLTNKLNLFVNYGYFN